MAVHYKAIIKETGEEIQVYRLTNGNYHDLKAIGANERATSKTGKKEFKPEEITVTQIK